MERLKEHCSNPDTSHSDTGAEARASTCAEVDDATHRESNDESVKVAPLPRSDGDSSHDSEDDESMSPTCPLGPATRRVVKPRHHDESLPSLKPGAYVEGRRAFGEMPAWQQHTTAVIHETRPEDTASSSDQERQSIVEEEASLVAVVSVAQSAAEPSTQVTERAQRMEKWFFGRNVFWQLLFTVPIVIALGVGVGVALALTFSPGSYILNDDIGQVDIGAGWGGIVRFCKGANESVIDLAIRSSQDADGYCSWYANKVKRMVISSNSSTASHCEVLASMCLNRKESQSQDEAFFVQFALSDIFFSTGGPSWRAKEGWIGHSNWCSWAGVECSGSGNIIGLDLNFNNLQGSIPSSIGFLTDLTVLDIRKNQIYGKVPSELNHLTDLVELWMTDNLISGTFPDIPALQRLTSFNIEDNAFVGDLSKIILNLRNHAPHTTQILANHNSFTGTIPTEIGDLTRLERIRMDTNSLRSTIPSEVGRLIALELIQVAVNHLSGTIPSEIGLLTNLKHILIQDQTLSGTIPNEFFHLTQLETIQANSCFLSGYIPTEVGLMTNLHILGFFSGRLTGTIPSELGLLTKLTDLTLQLNRLHGTITKELANLTGLDTYELHTTNNEVVGPVDPALCERFRRIEFCRAVECDCCHESSLSGCDDPIVN